MSRKQSWVGIDVSARSLAVAIDLGNGKGHQDLEFENTPSGHSKLASRITRSGRGAQVCLEATGTYHLDLALHLDGAKRVVVMVVNPRASRSFANGSISCATT